MSGEREEWMALIRDEYDPKPNLGRGDYPAFGWDDGAGRIADAILADKMLLLRKHADEIERLQLDLAFCREAMRHADIDLSVLLPDLDNSLQKGVRRTLGLIDEARRRSLEPQNVSQSREKVVTDQTITTHQTAPPEASGHAYKALVTALIEAGDELYSACCQRPPNGNFHMRQAIDDYAAASNKYRASLLPSTSRCPRCGGNLTDASIICDACRGLSASSTSHSGEVK